VLWHCWLGIRKGIWLQNWLIRCRYVYLLVARCKWFTYGPADATATPSSLASLKSRMLFGQPLQVTVCPKLQDHCPVCLSVCNTGVLWPNSWTDQDATWYEVGLGLGDSVRWGPSSHTERGTEAPTLFSPCLLWPNGHPSKQLLSSCYLSGAGLPRLSWRRGRCTDISLFCEYG